MSESATDALRRILDERGVEHYDGTESTLWLKDEHGYRASADELSSGRLSVHIWCDTPEQAIAATLESGTCEFIPFADEDWSEPNAVRGVCSKCSALMYGKDNYCPNCGKRIRKKVDE